MKSHRNTNTLTNDDDMAKIWSFQTKQNQKSNERLIKEKLKGTGKPVNYTERNEKVPPPNHLIATDLETKRIVFYKKGLFLKN